MRIGYILTVGRFIGLLLKKLRLLLIKTIRILSISFLQLNRKKMSYFRGLYQKYLETIDSKNCIVELEFKDALVLIKVIACRNEINSCKQLSVLNNFHDDFEIENRFALTNKFLLAICHASIFIFKSNRL